MRLYLGILHTSRGTSGRKSEFSECRGTTRPRSTAPAAMHHEVEVTITRQIGQRHRPEETADTPQDSLKIIRLQLPVETRAD